jgi:PAS domain-containing protein
LGDAVDQLCFSLAVSDSAFFTSISTSAQRLAARKAGDARFQLLFEQAMDGVMIAGAGGCFMEVNSCLCWISGYSRDELLGKNIALAAA